LATGFRNVKDIVDTELSGAVRFSGWRKVPSASSTANVWFDISMSPGNPSPLYYASSPLEAQALSYSSNGGINHGISANASGNKLLRKFMAMTSSAAVVPMPIILMDYLLYYPFVDEGTSDNQVMTNAVSLPRYADGAGVKILPICVAAGAGGAGVTFICSYTNQDGVSGRTTVDSALGTGTATGSIATSAPNRATSNGPFLTLQGNDTGVRSIESVTFTGALDVGLITLVLVKPIAQMSIRNQDAPVDIDYLVNFSGLPEIKNDAFLSFICCPSASLNTATIMGTIETIWKD